MDFEGVHITLSDILPQIQKIIYGSILIGHDMTNDMQVLKLPHQ
jgi:DNA polymerase III epsilon subunit-like protein